MICEKNESIFKQFQQQVMDSRATQKETLQTCLFILHNREAAQLQLHVAKITIFIFYEALERKQKKLVKKLSFHA